VKQLKKGRGIKINEDLQFVLYFRSYQSGKIYEDLVENRKHFQQVKNLIKEFGVK
jgi:hypothetical protein